MGQKQGKVWKERSYKAAAGLPTWYSTKLREVGQVEVGMVAVQALVTPMDLPNELELLQVRHSPHARTPVTPSAHASVTLLAS
jgi:hypothetical protein